MHNLTKTIKDPLVTVPIQSHRSDRVYMNCEVRSPGLLLLNDIPMILLVAIGRAGAA